MAEVKIEGDNLLIRLSLTDRLLTFHGSFTIPLSHVTNAYVSGYKDLELQGHFEGLSLGNLKSGVYADHEGLIFVDVAHGDCLVIETRGERFPRIAVQLPQGVDPNALAHEIVRAIPDAGPVVED